MYRSSLNETETKGNSRAGPPLARDEIIQARITSPPRPSVFPGALAIRCMIFLVDVLLSFILGEFFSFFFPMPEFFFGGVTVVITKVENGSVENHRFADLAPPGGEERSWALL